MNRIGRYGVGLLVIGAFVGCASGSVTYTAATRTVQAGGQTSPATFTAADFGPFSHMVSQAVGFSPACSASMNSALNADTVVYSGRVSASGDHSSGVDFYGYANALQTLQVDLSQTTAVWLAGSTTFVQGYPGNIGASATIRRGTEASQALPTTVDTALRLPAGSYTIATNISSGAGPNFGITATADYSFTIHMDAVCTVDFDQSGTVQVADIFEFLNQWFAGSPAADFDGANGLQVADIFAFLDAWFIGC